MLRAPLPSVARFLKRTGKVFSIENLLLHTICKVRKGPEKTQHTRFILGTEVSRAAIDSAKNNPDDFIKIIRIMTTSSES